MAAGIPDHYEDLTFEELQKILHGEELRVDQAVKRKEWKLAAKLEESLGPLREAVEQKRPIKRASLEETIEKVQKDLVASLARKEWDTCTDLQKQLDGLIAKRAEMPTRNELKTSLKMAESDLDGALARKAFKQAESLQDTINDLKKQLEGFPSTEDEDDTNDNHGFSSRAELESEISLLSNQIDSAVVTKAFAKAASLQERVVELEKIRVFLPTIAELEKSIEEASKAVQRAVSAKNFKEAEDLHSSLDELQKKLDFERNQIEPVTVSGTEIESTKTKTEVPYVSSTPQKLVQNELANTSFDVPPLSVIVPKTPKDGFSGGRPVYKLRPKKPIIVEPHQSVLSVARTITSGRGDAALIVLNEEGFAGVLTPHHITEKVVTQGIDAASISVSSVMKTKRGVALDDSAGDALSNMLENKHRYLPVMDDFGALVGILDIGQCLNDAIKKLKTANERSSKVAQDMMEQIAPGAPVKDLLTLLGPALKQAFGESVSPSLRSLLVAKPSSIVSPTTSVRDAACVMTRDDKAALVVDEGKLIGIVTVKHIMENAVAKQVDMELSVVKSIMDPYPVPVSPDITAVEALQIMHEDRVLSLPVCEDDGTTLGSVDVMDLIYGCGGAESWRSIFDTSMANEDATDTESTLSCVTTSNMTARSHQSVSPTREYRPVHQLRPKRPVVVDPDQSILSVAQTICKARADAALIKLRNKPGFAGVLTPHHITEKVLANYQDPAATLVSSVMKTKRAVKMKDSAGDALDNMLENRHRYLPVMDDFGALVGILDIGQCLSDAITRLEREQKSTLKAAQNALSQVAIANSGPGDHVNQLQALLGPVLQAAFGESASPPLSTILEGKASNIVSPDTSVERAASIIAKHDKAALVMDGDELVGMVTVKDIMEMVVAKELDPRQTPVSTVMTTYPQYVPPDMTALEALQVMHQDRISSLPVSDDYGNVFGSVDVLDLIYGCGGAKGWKSIFDTSMEAPDNASDYRSSNSRASRKKQTATLMSPPHISDKLASPFRPPEIKVSPWVPALVEVPEIPFKSKFCSHASAILSEIYLRLLLRLP
eukprot:scaffold8649_cov185-Amphora_coffeaeformis.AAC.11